MDNNNESRGVRRYRRDEVERHLQDYRTSGLSQSNWAASRGIRVWTLRYWLKREREEKQGYSLVPVQVESSPQSGFLEFEVNGVVLKVSAGSDLKTLAGLVRELS